MTARALRAVAGSMAAAVAVALFVVPRTADAQVQVEVLPVLGEGCVPRNGPTEFMLGLTNTTATPLHGALQIEALAAGGMPGVRTVESVPFSVGPRGRATARVATPSIGFAAGDLLLSVFDDDRRPMIQRTLHYDALADAMLLDATAHARLAHTIRLVTSDPGFAGGASTATPSSQTNGLTGCPAMRIPQTGELVLPRTRAGYGGVAMVIVDSTTLIALPAAEVRSLADYLLVGGSLAVVVTEPDELRHPVLQALVGLGVRSTDGPAFDASRGGSLSLIPGIEPGGFPQPTTLAHLRAFDGGNLHHRMLPMLFMSTEPGLLGATGDYGAGSVHLLSFDPTAPPAVDDPWTVATMTRLAAYARSSRRFPIVEDTPQAAMVPPAVRRALDPNEGFRPGLGLAVVVLVLYAILIGPVSFRMAKRRNKPLRALAIVPIGSMLVFAGIVTLGGVSRGFQGHARRLAIMELSAGVPRGPVRRFHGYYSGESGGMTVEVTHPGDSLYVDPQSGTGYVTLSRERDRSALRGLAVMPWTTLVVRQESFETLAGSLTLQPDAAGGVRIVNRTGMALRNVVVTAAGGSMGWSIRAIRNGETFLTSQGAALVPTVLGALSTGSWTDTSPAATASGAALHPGWQIASLFDPTPESTSLWDAVVTAVPLIGSNAATGPVLIAEAEVVDHDETDGDLPIERDSLVIRVAGWGGAP